MNDIEAARARADAAIRAAAAPMSPEARVMDLERRLDRWVNYATGLGTFEDKTRASSFEPPWRLSDVELTALASGNDLAAKCIEKRPDEMFRRGYSLEGQKPGAINKSAIDEISAYATEDLKANERLHEAMTWGRQYGGALNILGINDGRTPDQPVDEDNIQSIDFVNVLDRRMAYVNSYYSNLSEPGLGQAESYLVANAVATSSYRSSDGTKFGYKKRTPDQIRRAAPGASVLTIHESRVLRFDGVVPDVISRQTLAGWSWSVLQRPYEIMRLCDGSFDALGYLISDASQGVLKLKGLFAAISGGKEKNLQSRLETMDRLRSVMHTIALDADGQEDFSRVSTSFAGLPEALDRIMQRVAAAFDMPLTEVFGMSPAGMNATGESDRIHWYDTVATEQTKYLAPRLKRLYRLIALSKDGPLKGKGGDFKIKFHPLYAPTDDELAKTRGTNATRDVAYIDAEVVTPQQVALTLTEVYPSIDADELEEAIDQKVKFDPLENDPNEADDVKAKLAAKAAAKPAAPNPFAAHALPVVAPKPGVAKTTPASGRESTPAKAQAAPAKKADFDPDQARAANGEFGEGGAQAASQAAADKSRQAKRAPSPGAHLAAAEAHELAADAHRAAASLTASPPLRAMHEKKAAAHDRMAAAHEQAVETTLKNPVAPKHVNATREQWAARPNRESLGKRLGKVAVQIRERDGHKCVYCGAAEPHVPPAKAGDKHQLDHLVPRIQGGKDEATNLVTACKRCNSARHDMSVRGWSVYAKQKYGLHFSPSNIYAQAQKALQ
jgi:phage-related protein (TIGR01555 family)